MCMRGYTGVWLPLNIIRTLQYSTCDRQADFQTKEYALKEFNIQDFSDFLVHLQECKMFPSLSNTESCYTISRFFWNFDLDLFWFDLN